jgi:hypothetical protein
MATRVTVHRDDQGRLVVRKTASADRRLSAEAVWLGRARGAGVAVLVDADPDGGSLTTRHAGSHTWRTAAPAPATAGPLLACLLRNVAELHRRDLVHGAIGPDHVVLGPDGPVLCGPKPGCTDPGVDRLALADLIDRCRRAWSEPPPGTPHRRADDARWRRAGELLAQPDSGWTLEAVADLLDDPPAPAPATGARRPSRPRRARRPGRLAPVAALVVAGGLAVTLWALPGWSAQGRSSPILDRAPAGERAAGTDGRRYRVDQVGLPVAVADRPCPGAAPAAVLHPDDGTVWAFDRLPTLDDPVTGEAVAVIPGASGLVVRDETDCRRILAVGPAGEAGVPAPRTAGPVRPTGEGG